MRDTRDIERLCVLEYVAYGFGHRAPPRFFNAELTSSGRSDLVGARAAVMFGGDRACFDPPSFFHAMQARIERAFLDAQGVRQAMNVGRDRVTVKRSPAGQYGDRKSVV